ncbi:hypothetical protein D3C81_2060830 [compost metagenome]
MRQALGQQRGHWPVQRQRLAQVAVQGPPQQVEVLLEDTLVQPVVGTGFGQVLGRQAIGFHARCTEHDRQGVTGQQIEDEVGDGVGAPQH